MSAARHVAPVRLREAVRAATETLAAAGIASAGADAVLLAAHALQRDPAEVRRRLVLGAAEPGEQYAELVSARARRVPLQHLTGVAPFRGLSLAVGPGVFVPRPETEVLVDHVLAALDDPSADVLGGRRPRASGVPAPRTLVDLATGSGAIGFAVKSERPATRVFAVERSRAAFAWAKRNRERLGLDVVLERGDARTAFEQLRATVDVVSANPPYLVPGGPLDPEVADHDPAEALYGGGPDGLELPLALVDRAAVLLRPGGRLVLEHGDEQAPALLRALSATGRWSDARDHPDLTGRPRVLVAVRAPAPGPDPGRPTSEEDR